MPKLSNVKEGTYKYNNVIDRRIIIGPEGIEITDAEAKMLRERAKTTRIVNLKLDGKDLGKLFEGSLPFIEGADKAKHQESVNRLHDEMHPPEATDKTEVPVKEVVNDAQR
jgi:hypothetical protein